MSFYRDYPNRKDWRKPYRGTRKSANFDYGCRNHGACGYCLSNRMFAYNKANMRSLFNLQEYIGKRICHQ